MSSPSNDNNKRSRWCLKPRELDENSA